MNGSDVTVVIPTYRRPQLLARALESVLAQETPALRVRVFDNASGDETERVVRAVGQRHPVEYFRHDANIGCSRNIQASINSVSTPYCCILNDDDLQLPGLIHSALEALPAHPTAMAFCGRTAVYDHEAKTIHRIQGAGWKAGFYRAGEMTREMMREHFTPTGVVFATEALQKLRFVWGDMEMMARLADRHDFLVGQHVTGVFMVHPQSWTASHSLDEDRKVALNRLDEYLQLPTLSTAGRLEATLRTLEEMAHQQLQFGLGAVTNGDRSAERRREMRQAALLLNALQDAHKNRGLRMFRAVAAALAGNADAPMSRPAVFALRAMRRLSSFIDRQPAAVPSDEDRTTVAWVAELDRRAAIVMRDLPA